MKDLLQKVLQGPRKEGHRERGEGLTQNCWVGGRTQLALVPAVPTLHGSPLFCCPAPQPLWTVCLGDPPNSMSPAPDLPAGKRGSFCPKALRQASPPGLHPRGTAPLGPSPHGMFHDDPVATSECIFVIPPVDI
ncbi:Cleavage Stimulation Factor Subunit 3 [Manis pentadactyla]|nr:Cleavage Stimulation Factor Subunit 3 [Manis pentadactyla]